MPTLGVTASARDLFNAIKKRVESQGHVFSDQQILTLTLDVMSVVVSDSATVVSHSSTELANNKQRDFQYGE